MRKTLFVLLYLCFLSVAFALPSFDTFSNGTTVGGTSYAAGAGLFHQTNALGEGWSLWNGGSGSSVAEVVCVSSNLVYGGFPAGFPAPPSGNSVALPGATSAVSGFGAALQFSRVVAVDPNSAVTNKIFASFLMEIPDLGSLDAGSPIYFGGFATNSGDQNIALPSKATKLFLKGNGGSAGSSTSYSIGIQVASGTGTTASYDSGGHTTASVLFVVMDYEFGINGAPDVANLWINPPSGSFGSVNPPAATASVAASSASGRLLQAADFYLLARNGTSLWGSLLVSDLRIGDTWGYATGGPEVITPPANATNGLGTTAILAVQALAGATNVSPLKYQWQFNGVKLSGSTNATLVIPNLTAGNAGMYSVVVSNSVAALTNSASLTVFDPGIATNPVSQMVIPGSSVSFSVTAVGTPTLTHQWQENGVNLTDGGSPSGCVFNGARTPKLQLSNVGDAENGAAFTCSVTNGNGVGAISTGATLTVGDPIMFSLPQNNAVSLGGTASFSAMAFGTPPLTWQWQKNGVNLTDGVGVSGAIIAGSASTNLVITGVGYADAFAYDVVVSNAHSASVTSPAVFLTVTNSTLTNTADELNVRAFGAAGDGVTDDTAAFGAAIVAAKAGNHNGVYVPTGQYVISGTLTLNGLELIGKFAGGWPADTFSMPTLLIRQYAGPAIALINGASVHGLALDYDLQTPTTSNAPAISLQDVGPVVSSVRIQNAYDAISTPSVSTPGRARLWDILIVQPTHTGVQISKCYDFVQCKHIEVRCPGVMSTGPAFSFGRVDEGGYTGLVASNCAVGIQFYNDTDSGGGQFTGNFADCVLIGCSNSITVSGDHKIKITGGDFTSLNSGIIIDGTNAEVTLVGGKWQANAGQAVQVVQAANFIIEDCIFSRATPLAAPLVLLNNSTTVTVNGSQFLPGSTGLELDSLLQRAIITGNSFEDGGVTNLMTSPKRVIAGNLITTSPPMNLTAIAGVTLATLIWTPVLGATSYNINRSLVTGGPYVTVANATAAGYTNAGLSNGTTYYYVVSAVKPGGSTTNSTEVSVTPEPSPPSGLITMPGNVQIALIWTAAPGATNYNIKRSATTGGPYTMIGNSTATGYTDIGVTNGTAYFYVVSALVLGNETANSGEASAVPQIPVPPVPANLVATATNGQVNLNWLPSARATNYYVLRALTSSGPYSVIGTTPLSGWTDQVVWNGTRYFYVVVAVDATGESANSSEVSALPQITLNLNLSLQQGNQLNLSWPGSATNLELYSTTSLAPPIMWQPVTNLVQSNSGFFSLTLPFTNHDQQFFRLDPP